MDEWGKLLGQDIREYTVCKYSEVMYLMAQVSAASLIPALASVCLCGQEASQTRSSVFK